jgi:hypothetical protein
MEFNNIKIYGINESIKASSMPHNLNNIDYEYITLKDISRAIKLGKAKSGSGHDCYLKGIIVQVDITAPQMWWQQAQRYHWFDFISSQSKMHSIINVDFENNLTAYVDNIIKKRIIELQKQYIENPTKDNFRVLIDSCPMGLLMTARMTTNYLQLKTMYYQRKEHKLDEWSVDFVKFCQDLPQFLELI